MPHVNELHDQHDQILVVSFASGDLAADDRDRATAQALIDSCTECAGLYDDIVAIARATRALPPAVRTHDFRLTPEQASKLRPTGWRRFVAGLSAPGSIFSRQLGVGLATLGVAGLLLSSAPSIQLGMGGSAAASAAPSAPAAAAQAPEYDRGAALSGAASPAASAPAASAAPVFAGNSGGTDTSAGGPYPVQASPSDQGGTTALSGPGPKATALPTIKMPEPEPTGDRTALLPENENPAAAPPASGESGSGTGPSGLVIVSTVLLGAGVLVLLLRSISRRVAAG